jgi:hypothetical protein
MTAPAAEPQEVLKLEKRIKLLCARAKVKFTSRVKSTLESFFWNQRVLLCGSSGAYVTAESDSS